MSSSEVCATFEGIDREGVAAVGHTTDEVDTKPRCANLGYEFGPGFRQVCACGWRSPWRQSRTAAGHSGTSHRAGLAAGRARRRRRELGDV